MDGGRDRPGLSSREYEALRRAAETYREELVLELGAEVGLRSAEMTRVRPADLAARTVDGDTHYFLSVPAGDGERHDAYVPRDVAHDLRKYVNSRGCGDDDPVLDVSPRRVQMLVTEVAERAAAENPALADVTSSDLRATFARRLLVEEDVHPRVVRAAGGWASLDSLAPYLDDPTPAEIAAALADDGAARDATGGRQQPGDGRTQRAADGRALGDALRGVSTREEVEEATCETLASVYRGAWVCDEQGAPQAWAGVGDGDARETIPDAVARTGLVGDRGVADGDVHTVRAALRDRDGERRDHALAVIPLRSSDAVHGLLCVVGDGALRRDAGPFLADAGQFVGWAIAAVERKRLLLADTSVELVFEVRDDRSFFAAASAALDCRFDLEGLVPVADQALLYFVTARGASVEDVLDRAAAADAVSDVRLIRADGERAQLEFVVVGDSPAATLVAHGGRVDAVEVADGVSRLTGVFSNQVNVRRVVEDLADAFPDSELVAKRDVEEPVQTAGSVRQAVEAELTEKQRSVLQAAYFAGYFEWPRGSTGEELAESMGVSAPTLHNHLRKAQQKVLTAIFEESP